MTTMLDEKAPIDSEIEYHDVDVFGNEEGHEIKYKTLTWPVVAMLMICEIVSNGMFSLPSAMATVGLVPGTILIVFLGIFALYTSWLLVNFKLNHPEVHNMGDAGLILFGPIGREVLAFGTVVFAIFGTGSQLLAGQIALTTLSDGRLLHDCGILYTAIFTIPVLIFSFIRTFDRLGWLSILACISILVAGIVGIIAAGLYPVAGRVFSATKSSDFYSAFSSVLNPVFAYAGHFMFFVLISEMKRPQDAMKAAWALATFSTVFYVLFAVMVYIWIGDDVSSPALSSLPPVWAKAAFGIAIPNFLIAGALYSHTAAKLFFIRFFRNSRHLHSHTVTGWSVWTVLILIMNGGAFVLAVGVPIFNYLVGLAASLFAAWYTYGLAGAFWLHDSYHGAGGGSAGLAEWRWKWFQTTLSILTFVAGAFICVAGTYVTIRGIVDAYSSGATSKPFAC